MNSALGAAVAVGLLDDDERLCEALCRGDEAAFASLVRRYHGPLVRLAYGYVKRDDVAEEVAQEAWQGFVESLPRFVPQASLKTWLYRILTNCARARRRKERHSLPMSALATHDDDAPAVDPERFHPEGHPWAGHWAAAPRSFVLGDPAASAELRALLAEALEALPDPQREVMVLRDVHGLSGEEVASTLELSEGNQRVLLHRARTRVRSFIEERLGGGPLA